METQNSTYIKVTKVISFKNANDFIVRVTSRLCLLYAICNFTMLLSSCLISHTWSAADKTGGSGAAICSHFSSWDKVTVMVAFDDAQGYVMLSRVENLEQVYILSSINEGKLKPSPKALAELEKMNKRSINQNPKHFCLI